LEIVRKNPEEIRIGWAGGHSHWEDLHMIREPLKEIGEKYPNVKIVMLGYKPATFEADYRKGQVEFHEWVDFAAHPYRLAAMDLDIGLIPLKENQFNMCKSEIKLVEYSALNVPSVCSYVGPYVNFSNHDQGENAIYIDGNDKSDWLNAMELLINNTGTRKKIGDRARKTVEDHYDINKKYTLWLDAYNKIMNKGTKFDLKGVVKCQ
jgi:O-antigen biosynthesis protein